MIQYIFYFVLASLISSAVFGVFYTLFRWWKPLPFLIWGVMILFGGPFVWALAILGFAILLIPFLAFAFVGAVWSHKLISESYENKDDAYLPFFFGVEGFSLFASFFNPWFRPLEGNVNNVFLILYAIVALASPPFTAYLMYQHRKFLSRCPDN